MARRDGAERKGLLDSANVWGYVMDRMVAIYM